MPKVESLLDFRAVCAAVSMEQVLEHYGVTSRFRRHADSLTGPCPIHDGTNPTQFRVSLSKQLWNCFSQCKCGGNVLDFVAQMEHTTLPQAAERLADWFQLDRTKFAFKRDDVPQRIERRVASAPKLEPEKSTGEGTKVPTDKVANRPLGFRLEVDPSHPYLTERGLTPEIIDEFGLGYCARGSLAGRIAIPIHNSKGELVAYAGRWPGEKPENDRPKYKLPEGFRKAHEVYRLAEAKREPAGLPWVIVEGYFDAMRLWQLGVRKVVALMGSSLSQEQEKLLVDAFGKDASVVILFDEDEAGRTGRMEILQRLAWRASVRVASFADGFTPKDLTREQAVSLGILTP